MVKIYHFQNVRISWKYLLNFFYSKLNYDQEKANDLLQDLFLKIIEKPELFDINKKFGVKTNFNLPNELSKRKNTIKENTLENNFPKIYKKLISIKNKLEKHFRNMQDIEFTIENKKLCKGRSLGKSKEEIIT